MEDLYGMLLVSFFRYDVNNDHYLDLMEMKQMMEKLGAPQTHVGLKAMIAEIDEDNDGKVSFREVIIIPVLHFFFLALLLFREWGGVFELINAPHFLFNFFSRHLLCWLQRTNN